MFAPYLEADKEFLRLILMACELGIVYFRIMSRPENGSNLF